MVLIEFVAFDIIPDPDNDVIGIIMCVTISSLLLGLCDLKYLSL